MFRPVVFSFFLLSTIAQASVGERFGFTSEAAALGSARSGARDFSSASAYENPAQMSLSPSGDESDRSRFRFHWSLLYSESSFENIEGVVVENPVVSDTTREANVDTNYPATLGQSIGFSVQSRKSPRRWGFGVIAYLPLDQLALVDSGEAFVPEYALHRGRTHKPEFQTALSALVAPNLSLGVGLYLGARLESDTTIFLNQGTGTVSTMRISAKLKTKATPYFGLSYVATDSVSVGVVARLASSLPQTLNVQSSARAIGNVSALDFSFPAVGTMYYDPFSVQLGTQLRYARNRSLYLQVDYQSWSRFRSPAIIILDPSTSNCDPNCGVDFAEGRSGSARTRDIFVPRIGHAWRFGRGEMRMGLLHRPGIYRDHPTGAGNALDPSESRIVLGYGWDFDSLLVFDAPGRLDLHAMYAQYERQEIQKTPGDENGNLANRKVGDPGYRIGGNAWGGGMTILLYL